jgi:cysteine-rich repeat protein
MSARARFRALLLVASILSARHAAATIDVSGRWGVVVASPYFPDGVRSEWDFQQTGTALVLTITFTDPSISGTSGPRAGTIDPDSGVFTVDLLDADVPLGFPPCPDSRIDGTASPDGLAIGGSYTSYFFGTTPTTFGCNASGGPFSGGRCPGAEGCCAGPSCCGNGVVEPPEQCDDGNQRDGDCCSSTCQFEPAGSSCTDANVCTEELGCDGAGTCRRIDVSGPCGTTCWPGTCTGGYCIFGAFSPAGTPCDDGNACTADDGCTGGGTCLGQTAVTCGPCELCDPRTGCIASALASCDIDASSALTLSVPRSGKSSVSWRRVAAPGAQGLAGDPTAGTEYDVCIFGASGLLFQATVPPARTCGDRPCWAATPDGFRFRDRTGASYGLRRLDLAGDGAFGVRMVARGTNVTLPDVTTVTAPVVVELRARNVPGAACWQSRFDGTSVVRRTTKLRARN